MLWLISQMWLLLLVAFLAGAAAGVWVFSARGRRTAAADKSGALDESAGLASAPAMLLDRPDGQQDDLTQIIGIDRATEKRLNDLGVYHLRQIAAWDDGAARWVEIRLNEPGRISRERWSEQASSLR